MNLHLDIYSNKVQVVFVEVLHLENPVKRLIAVLSIIN